MSAQTYKTDKKPHRHEQVVDHEYEVGGDPDYEDAGQASYDEGSDPDYDEGAQVDYGTDFVDGDGDEGNGSQEYRKRSQK